MKQNIFDWCEFCTSRPEGITERAKWCRTCLRMTLTDMGDIKEPASYKDVEE